MSEDSPAQRRAYYRLRYPAAERPAVEAAGRVYPVIELSEGGIRLQVEDPGSVRPGAAFAGFIRFHDGELEAVRGEWLRVETAEGIILLTAGVSIRRVLDEQRRLIRTYPTHDGPADHPGPGHD